MGCDIHIRAEVRVEGTWWAVGRVFESPSNHGPYVPATRENLEVLTDGQLLDAFSWQGRSEVQVMADHARYVESQGASPFANVPGRAAESAWDPETHDYHRAFRETLSPKAREAFRAFNVRRDEHNAVQRARYEEWRETVRAYDAEHGEREFGDSVPEEVSFDAVVRPRERAALRELRDVTLEPEVRESIISAVSAYRYGDADEAEDPEYGGLDVSFELAEGDPPHLTVEPYEGRNYDLFGVLANVRNGGRRGEPQRVKPIDEPRGRPADIAEETDHWLDRHGDHSDSYLHLDELEAYEWDEGRIDRWGIVSEEQYLRFRDSLEYPRSWSEGIGGAGIRTFAPEGYEHWVGLGRPYIPEPRGRSWLDDDVMATPELVDALIAGKIPYRRPTDNPLVARPGLEGIAAPAEAAWGLSGIRGDATGEIVAEPEQTDVREVRPYVRIEWVESSHGTAPRFTEYTIPALRNLIPDGGTSEDVRVVFSFDS